MARSKEVSRKAGGGHVSAGEDTPGRYERPVLTQEVEAAQAEATAKARHAAQRGGADFGTNSARGCRFCTNA